MITKTQIQNFFISKRGYLKKSPTKTVAQLYKINKKDIYKSNKNQLTKELELISEIRKVMAKPSITQTVKTLILDIEVSPNTVLSWRIGRKIDLSPDNILNERAIICVAYKWLDAPTTQCIQWNNGDDKQLVKTLSNEMQKADAIITQNGDAFDLKWIRTRCIYHSIPLPVKFNSIDTLKMARAGFKFNSNKLDYMGNFLGVGNKTETTYGLWKDILLKNCKVSMKKMIDYCKEDVMLTERVYNKLKPYCPTKKFRSMPLI